MANSASILTDASPPGQRGMALGINQVAGVPGVRRVVLGGLLAAWDWRAIFVDVPIDLFGTIWAYRSLREIATTRKASSTGSATPPSRSAPGCCSVAITYGIRPYGNDATGWANPMVDGGLALGVALLALFCFIETKVKDPMFRLSLFRIRAFAAGNIASLLGAIARGGLQFMLVIWLAGIWLPLHGYDFTVTPLWAGIYMLPLTAGFLIAGPLSGILSDRFGARPFATGGLLVAACCFTGLLLLPIDFRYWVFALLIFGNGVGSGLFASPNTAAIMSSVPAHDRGAASGMRSTFQNSGMSLSIGIFFSLLIAGLANTLPKTLTAGLTAQGVPLKQALTIAHLPPVSTVFSAMLGYNPVQNMLAPTGLLRTLPAKNVAVLTGRQFFPTLISGPFHHGLMIVFTAAALMALTGAAVSWMRGKKPELELPRPPSRGRLRPPPLTASDAEASTSDAHRARTVRRMTGPARAPRLPATATEGRRGRIGLVPRYEFRCRACGDTFLVTRPMSESGAPAACPQGHDDTVKLLSTVAVGGRASRPLATARPATLGGGGGCCGGGCGCG